MKKKKLNFILGLVLIMKNSPKNTYLELSNFLNTFPNKPNVIDLGCGDFVIGSKLRSACGKYIAVDIFDDLINYNKVKYSDLQVDFKTLDITKDELPEADICFLRTVLQHLSNEVHKKIFIFNKK